MQTKVEFTKVSVPTIALCIGMSWGLAGLFWFQKLLCFWFLHFGRPVRRCCLPLLEYCYHPALWFQLLIDRNRKFLLQVKVCSIYRHNTKCTFIIYIYIYICGHPPPMTDHPLQNIAPTGVFVFFRSIEFEPAERALGTPEDRDQETKAPRRMLDLFWFFGYVGFLVFLYFGCSVFCVCRGKSPVSQNQNTIKTKYQNTNTKNQKNKTGPAFSVELWFLVSVSGWLISCSY